MGQVCSGLDLHPPLNQSSDLTQHSRQQGGVHESDVCHPLQEARQQMSKACIHDVLRWVLD